jgi:hypothetical protein
MVLDRDPGADVRDLPGVAVRWADCRFPFWNAITLTDVGADADLHGQRRSQAAGIMRAKQVGVHAPVHLSVEHLDAVDVTFRSAGAPGTAEPAGDGGQFRGCGEDRLQAGPPVPGHRLGEVKIPLVTAVTADGGGTGAVAAVFPRKHAR